LFGQHELAAVFHEMTGKAQLAPEFALAHADWQPRQAIGDGQEEFTHRPILFIS
jgi:hypothetical protein